MASYSPQSEILDSLRDKTVVMLVGPVASGKSTIMNEVVRINHYFGRVGGVTTRQPRPNDEVDLYRYASKQEAEQLIEDRQFVQYIEHPTTGMIYATETNDYTATYNLKDTLTSAVEPYLALPFKQHIVISVAAPAQDWISWLLLRYPEPSIERDKRLHEARISIEWSLAQTNNHHWIVNHTAQLTQTAQQLIEVALGQQNSSSRPLESELMLKSIETLLS